MRAFLRWLCVAFVCSVLLFVTFANNGEVHTTVPVESHLERRTPTILRRSTEEGVAPPYEVLVWCLLRRIAGDELLHALYDHSLILDAARWASTTDDSSPKDALERDVPFDVHGWTIFRRREAPTPPRSFAARSSQLRWIRQFISIGIGRVHRDEHLASRYFLLTKNTSIVEIEFVIARRAFEKALAQVLRAYVSYAVTVLQLVVDVAKRPNSSVLKEMASALSSAQRSHPLNDRVEVARKQVFLRDPGREVGELLSRVSANHAPYQLQSPKNARFWNPIRPTLQCHSLLRLCEATDGCRKMCNPQYTVYSGAQHLQSCPKDTLSCKSLPHAPLVSHFAGFGSNNEFEWEVSIVDMFSPRKSPDGSSELEVDQERRVGRIGSISTFDCTLKHGKWTPPSVLTDSPVTFRHASKCVDERPTEQSVTLADLKALLQNDSQHLFTTYKRSPDGTSIEQLAILKLDIEGYEFTTIPSWLHGELKDIDVQLRSQNSGGMIDFSGLRNFLPVDQLHMELHRMGHHYPAGASLASAQHAHLLLLQIAALGFMMVGQERNHYDNCCYETTFAHYRHFVESETWMQLNT